jgi:hypothetical protein
MSTEHMRSVPARLLNSVVLRFAGTPLVPLYGVIEHRGHRSGQSLMCDGLLAFDIYIRNPAA